MSVHEDIIKFGEESTVALVVTDPQRRVEYVNDAFTLLCGHEKREVLGKSPGELLQGPGTSPQAKTSIREALMNRTPFDAKILNYHKDSHSYIAGIYVVPFHDRFTGCDHFLALERELQDWDDELLDDHHFAKSLADIFCILVE